MNKIICIQTYGGSRVYVKTTEEKWDELTRHVPKVVGYMVSGWDLNQQWMQQIIQGAYPARMDFEVVARAPWRDYFKELGISYSINPPTPDYFIIYSNIDKPEVR